MDLQHFRNKRSGFGLEAELGMKGVSRFTCRSSSVRLTQASSDVNPSRRSRSPKLANSAPGPGTSGINPEEEAVGWKFLTTERQRRTAVNRSNSRRVVPVVSTTSDCRSGSRSLNYNYRRLLYGF